MIGAPGSRAAAVVACLALAAVLPGAPPAAGEDPPAPKPAGTVAPRPPNSAPPRDGPPPNGPGRPFEERVDLAIDEGVLWLKNQAAVSGTFGTITGEVSYTGTRKAYDYPAGPTALALYTLLKCGVPADDPVIQRGFSFLRQKGERPAIPLTSYEISAIVLALEAKSNPWKRERDRERDAKSRARRLSPGDLRVKLPPADAAWMRALVEQLLRRRQPRSGWRYNYAVPTDTGAVLPDPGFSADMSSTQLALLALAAAERCGFRQKDEVYASTLEWVLDQQEKDGPAVPRFVPGARPAEGGASAPSAPTDRARGWAYSLASTVPAETATCGSMTACGLADIALCTATLRDRDSALLGKDLAARSDRAWWDGVAWLQAHWAVDRNPAGRYRIYYLYCLERVGDLRSIHLLAGHDWYREGAQVLLDQQYPRGFWWDELSHSPCDLLSTCFALLFLERATVAVSTEE